MSRLALAALLSGLGALTLFAGSQDTVAQHRERVENGLRANITIDGKPAGPILERMRTLQVPGVGVAVIHLHAGKDHGHVPLLQDADRFVDVSFWSGPDQCRADRHWRRSRGSQCPA